jgi:hypothetical protein
LFATSTTEPPTLLSTSLTPVLIAKMSSKKRKYDDSDAATAYDNYEAIRRYCELLARSDVNLES